MSTRDHRKVVRRDFEGHKQRECKPGGVVRASSTGERAEESPGARNRGRQRIPERRYTLQRGRLLSAVSFAGVS